MVVERVQAIEKIVIFCLNLLRKDNKRLTKNEDFYLKGRNIIMKNIGWLGIVIIALGLGFSLG